MFVRSLVYLLRCISLSVTYRGVYLHDGGPGLRRRRAALLVVGVTNAADAARYGTPDDAFNWAEDEDLRADAKNRIEHWPVWK